MIRYISTLFLLIGSMASVPAQSPDFTTLKDEIGYYADMMVNAEWESHRVRAHEDMMSALDSFINLPGSFSHPLDDIPWLSVLQGTDFRLVSWQLRVTDEEYKYGAFIQWADRVVRFKDTRPFINGSEYSFYTPGTWYGCLYYKIIPFEVDKQAYYVLLGYNAETSLVNTKVADVLDLIAEEPRLGFPVFMGGEEPMTRLMMTYADVAPARMNFDEKMGGIVLDHVTSLPGVGPGGEALPVPDGSQDAWVLKKGKWVYEAEVNDVHQKEPPMSDDRKGRKEEKDILGRPKNK